ncbi:PREDICTED: GATA transcription factor 26-like isoform X3 [Lupinus angustifolius]|uniref:GATA transcription factor 26-like isoform X3 n=1 Tax=Lupinus angustifolius TaxID=3871 RepID=UPI00092F925D|nr:PREDICTED: GATA transcription factor 26-like isoform X3 [Lupinus angustifolius]
MTSSSANQLISISPDELRFHFELDKQTFCDLKVANNTESYVAFKVKTTSPKKYFVRPNTGLIQPWDSCIIRVTLQAQHEYPPDMQCKDKFLLQSTVVNSNTDVDELPPDTFTKESGNTIEEMKLRVAYISPNSPQGSSEDDVLKNSSQKFDASSDLLFESETPMVSVEIGHGTILMRHPSYIAREEESEASSLSIDNKQCAVNNAYLYPGAILMHNDSSGMNFSSQGVEKVRKTTGQGMQQEQLRRENSQLEREQILGGHDSPLRLIDLNDVVNYEEFLKNLTDAEQQQLLKFLPVVDAVKLPDSLKFMFNSSQFKENLTYFQQLLAEGVFDISLSGTKPEDCKTLKRHALSNLSKSKWVEHYYFLKIQRCKTRSGKSVTLGSNGTVSSYVAHVKRMCENQNQNSPELKTIMRSPKRVVAKAGYEGKEVVEDGSHYSPKSLFALPPEASSLFLDSSNFVEESSDQDLLLEVPSNSYFPEAELLPPTFSFGAQASTSNSSVYSHLN